MNPPNASSTVDPRSAASPAQVRAILTEVTRIRPDLTAFFGCLYDAALRPAEAVALCLDDCALPARGWGQLTLTRSCPRSGRAWTGNGTSHEQRGLKLRPEGTVRVVPIPPQLVALLRRHVQACGTTPGGRIFRAARGGILHESYYGRTWHTARAAALGPALAATPLARRPYDLRHAALSPVAGLRRPARRDRRTRRAQHPRPAIRLRPQHSRPRPDRQPRGRARPQPRPHAQQSITRQQEHPPPKTAMAMAIEDHMHNAAHSAASNLVRGEAAGLSGMVNLTGLASAPPSPGIGRSAGMPPCLTSHGAGGRCAGRTSGGRPSCDLFDLSVGRRLFLQRLL
jgi:hypothetical protein